MNQSLLRHLQSVQGFPCITLLHPTVPGQRMATDDIRGLLRLVDEAQDRLRGRVSDEEVEHYALRLEQLVARAASDVATEAVAICVSGSIDEVVRLGVPVRSRCVTDDTFATRDMVVDSKRTAVFRLFTVSEQRVRSFVGDRRRLVEERDGGWPVVRSEERTELQWAKAVTAAVERLQERDPLPVVLAGCVRSTRALLESTRLNCIDSIPGNHDRTSWAALHDLVWPLVDRWLRTDRDEALRRLERARSVRRFAGGIEEVWDLAREGRVELLVVEEQFEVRALVSAGRFERAEGESAAHVGEVHVVDDAVDDLIETVLRHGGDAVIVPEGDLVEHGRLAAVLRY